MAGAQNIVEIKCKRVDCDFVGQQKFDGFCCYLCGTNAPDHGEWCLGLGGLQDPGPHNSRLARRIQDLRDRVDLLEMRTTTLELRTSTLENDMRSLKRVLKAAFAVAGVIALVCCFV